MVVCKAAGEICPSEGVNKAEGVVEPSAESAGKDDEGVLFFRQEFQGKLRIGFIFVRGKTFGLDL